MKQFKYYLMAAFVAAVTCTGFSSCSDNDDEESTVNPAVDVGNVANVFRRKYAYHTFSMPDFDAMRKAAGYFEGKHDFRAFTTAKKNKSTERTIKRINIQYEGTRAYIRIEADDFLHNMARFMIGMLLDVGNGIKKPEDVKRCLDGENVQMSLPAESYGLFLVKVVY